MTTTKFPVPLTRILINITKGLNHRESTGNIILKMKKNVKRSKKILETEIFSFETVSKKDVLNLIKELP